MQSVSGWRGRNHDWARMTDLSGSLRRVLGVVLLGSACAMSGCGVPKVQTTDDELRTPRIPSPQSVTGLQAWRLPLDGLNRSFLLYVPPTAATQGGDRPLVLMIHGGGGTARGTPRFTDYRWQEIADEFGFYVAYPNAFDRFWDFGEGRTSGRLDPRVDDLAYFRRLLDTVSDALPIDRNRVFATGISRGGQASFFLACRLPGRIRAIAPIAMSLAAFLEDDCRRESTPVGLAVINGTEDPMVPYDGGYITFGNDRRDRVLSTDGTIALWTERNGCGAAADSVRIIDTADDGMRVVRSDWTSCTGAPVALFRIEGGGHTFPSGRRSLLEIIAGPVNQDINAADEAWAFFSRFE